MRLSILVAALVLTFAAPAAAQTPPAPPAVSTPAPADVASPEAIVAALYDVISGDAGVARDWDRFRSLFHPTGRLMPTRVNAQGVSGTRVLTPEDYTFNSRTMGAILMASGRVPNTERIFIRYFDFAQYKFTIHDF